MSAIFQAKENSLVGGLASRRAVFDATASTADHRTALDKFRADEALLLHSEYSLFGFAGISARQTGRVVSKVKLESYIR